MAEKIALKRASTETNSDCKEKRKAYEQKFRALYSTKYPCIVSSKVSTGHARCEVCELDFKICHGGLDDVKRHCDSKRHKEKSAALQNVPRVTNFFSSMKQSQDSLSVIRAETLFAHFLVEHNIPLSAADHAGPLFRAMFHDSTIAKEYSSGRTKTTSIIMTCSKQKTETLADAMKQGPFVIGTDGSQESGEKCYPIVVRVLSDSGIRTELLCNPTCDEASTGENIFNVLDAELSALNISWENCLALVCDNAYVMTGTHKGVFSYIKQKHDRVFLAACVCHLLSLALKKGIKASSKFDLDDTMRQLSWYLSKSSNRQQRLKQCQEKCGLPKHKLTDHVPTRWLSLGAALSRVLEQWEALKMFFKEECTLKSSDTSQEVSSIKMKLKEFFCRRTTKLYVHFFATVIEMFDKANKQLQTDHARIHLIKRDLEKLIRKLQVSFLKPSALNQSGLMEVDFKSSYNIKADENIFIGSQTQDHLNAGIDSKEIKNVKAFYQAACKYMMEKVNPSEELLWKHAEVADIKLKDTARVASLTYFMDRFPCLLQDGITRDEVHTEFLDYQAESSLPSEVTEKVNAEEQWQMMSKLTDHSGSPRFKNLSRVMLGILLIPVSNCACERIFSLVRKNRTDFRGSMQSSTLNALMVLKSGRSEASAACYQTPLSEDLLRKCKFARRSSVLH